MSEETDRILPDSDSGFMAQTTERWKSPPPLAALYRIQTLTKDNKDHFEVESWVVDRERMGEFFTDFFVGNRKLVDIRPVYEAESTKSPE